MALVATLTTGLAAPAWADAFADFKAARVAQNAGNWDEALRLYTLVIRSGELSGKNLAVAYGNRGNVHKSKRQYDSAAADFTKAMALKPGDVMHYNNRGNIYRFKGPYDRAIADSTKGYRDQAE